MFSWIFFLRVSHLILVDPWGFPERPKAENQESQGTEAVKTFRPPRWVKVIAGIVSFFNPLAVIRAAGPWGKSRKSHLSLRLAGRNAVSSFQWF